MADEKSKKITKEKTPELFAIKDARFDLGDVLTKIENGDANPEKIGKDVNEVFVNYIGGTPNPERMNAVTQPYQNAVAKATIDHNKWLEETKDASRLDQNWGEQIQNLEKVLGEIGQNFVMGGGKKAIKEASDLGYKLEKEQKELVEMGNVMKALRGSPYEE